MQIRSSRLLPLTLTLVVLPVFALTGCKSSEIAKFPVVGRLFPEEDDGPALAKLGPTQDQRIEIAERLAESDDPNAAQQLAQMIQQEQDPLVREAIVMAIGQHKSTPTLAVLRAATQDASADVRIACCQAWGEVGGTEATQQLTTVLQADESLDVRQAAARALGEFSSPNNVQALAVGLEDSDIAVQAVAMRSLRGLTGEDFDNNSQQWLAFIRGGRPAPNTEEAVADRIRSYTPF